MIYRRADLGGGTYFFTVNLANRKNSLLIDEINKLRDIINKVKRQHSFKLDAMVVLPDHLHAIWTLPAADNNYASRWVLIKPGFSRAIPKGEWVSESRRVKGERGIWQRRYWEHLIRDDRDYNNHVDYIHMNPVKHGYVKNVYDWPYSTFHEYVSKGVLVRDWGCGKVNDGDFGERTNPNINKKHET